MPAGGRWRAAVVAAGLATVLAACGGSDSSSAPHRATKPTARADPQSRYGVALSGSTTTVPGDVAGKRAADIGGTWTGVWANDTVGSSGTISVRINASILLHVSGSLAVAGPFLGDGNGRFPRMTLEMSLSSLPKYGSLRFEDSHGRSLTITDAPSHTAVFDFGRVAGHPEIADLAATVTRSEDAANPPPGRLDGTFTITFSDGTTANGSLHLTHQ